MLDPPLPLKPRRRRPTLRIIATGLALAPVVTIVALAAWVAEWRILGPRVSPGRDGTPGTKGGGG